jgi:threonine aldolase
MKTIDLRSDTVTRPTEAMRKAMATAEVGDDVYGEDPTVNRLQDVAAELTGKESALFVTSGTMGNQAAIAATTRPGDAVLVGENAHILLYESGAGAALWGVQVETVGSGGFFSGPEVADAIHPVDVHYAPARMLAIENTHNQSGGRVFPLARIKEAAAVARSHGLAVHLDGARIFNASVASGTPVATWAEPFDSLTFCLSKGLGAPIGSVLCGSADFISRAHRARKQMGGGMRQSGIIAAAGLHALEYHVERLADDHSNARRLATGLQNIGFKVDPFPETNIVIFQVEQAEEFEKALLSRDLLTLALTKNLMRVVTHMDVSEADVDAAISRIADAAKARSH